jgi:hypothetical protein
VVGLKRVQSLGRFNYNLGDSWSIILEQLDRRIDGLVKKELFTLPEIESKFGYKTIKSKLVEIGPNQFYDINIHRGSETRLDWENKMIHNVNPRREDNPIQNRIVDEMIGDDLLNLVNELDF